MAADEDSPSRCQGQSWTFWAQRVGISMTNDESEDDESKNKHEGDAMKLRKEDMPLFGFCPAQDEFYLVVCEMCRQVVKPQALKAHIELRHSTNALTKIDDVIGTSSSSSQQSHTASKLSSKDTQHHSHQRGSLSSVSGDRIGQTNRPSSCPPKHTEGIQQQTKGGGHCKSDSKTSNLGSSKKNHSLSSPVVRVERMSPSLMVKKPNSTMGPPGSAASPTTIPVDKRELPSPQQPPPLFFASPTSPCLSLPSPLNPLHNQQSPTISPSPPGSLVTTHPLSFQGIPLSSVATTAQTLQKRLVNNTLCATLSSSSMSLSSESKPKPCRSKSKIPKERKLLPCKDRVYDPDKHCGVFIQELGKQCTRSLTCKTHSLAMRRNVAGRRKNFDELLADHRAAKESLLKANKAGNLAYSHSNNSQFSGSMENGDVGSPFLNSKNSVTGGVTCKSNVASSKINHLSGTGGSTCITTVTAPSNGSGISNSQKSHLTSPIKPRTTASRNNPPISSLSRSPQVSVSAVSMTETVQKTSSESNLLLASGSTSLGVKDDNGFITHHPRPAAVCTYNARQMGLGYFVCDRRLDTIRAALRSALGDRCLQPPSAKKLCVESVLPPVPEPSDPSDPYHFSLRETQGSPAHRSAITSSETETFRSSPVIAEPSLTSNSTSLRTATNALVNSSSKSSQSKLGKIYRSAKGKQNKDNVANAGHPNTNHINRTLNTTCSVSTVQRCNVVDSVVSVSSTPLTQPTKRKRSSYVVARKCGPIVTSAVTASTVQKNSHTGASNAQVTTAQPSPSTGFLSLSFPIPISAHLAATVPHLGATKNGSVPGVVTPVCGATIQSARNHATSGTVHSLKDLNVTVTGVELINGQLGPNSGTILTRPTSTPCIPVTTADTIRSSLSSLGLGYTTSTLTLTTSSNLVTSLSGGSCRASVSPSSTCFATSTSVSSMSSSSVTSGTKEVRMSSAKRGKSSSFSIKSSRPIHSASVTAPSISSSTSKWNIVNNTAVLTGLGALSNATLLSGAHAPSSQLTINAVGGSSLSPPQSGIGCSSSFRTGSLSPLVASSSSPVSNGLGPSPPPSFPSLHHKNISNHILPDNTATFTISPGSHLNVSSPDHTILNCEVQHKGKGSRQNSSTKGSSNQKATHTNHPSLPSIHSNSAFPVVIGKAGTVGSANQAPGGNTVGSTRMGPTLGTINLATLPLSGKHGNSSSSSSSNNNTSNNSSSSSVVSSSQGSSDSSIVSLPLPSLNSSIPMKIMSATSSVSNKSQPAKSYLPTLDELKRPSEMQGSPSLPI